ncbi:outer membrane lipoprotein-sorting protein [Actibacterium sp. XHP0104]|uniref:outer membrane lipoprotein-sorting protein n=1 Tax=Actibacterium sp. XHP0104 TaxID=2984335 RepID=UPI0021E84A17|nr:outer membrane lipoprotein-sorting protein [Actibacterium sp. XHP0104]MCV2881307.1 outer membrane lipoprotein-sorting protein [Actibacterium sp. XHP0104]
MILRMFRHLSGALALAVVTWSPLPGLAQNAERGLEVMVEQDRRDAGWKTVKVAGTMILIDKAGRQVSRSFDLVRVERANSGDGDLSRMSFASPADVKGTVLLTHGKIEPADDNQWLFLPADRRVRRISSANRSGKFLSSEFSFEDMGGSEVPDNTYEWLRQEACPGNQGLTCNVVASVPRNPKSGYSQRIVWIDTQEYRPFQTDFYNRRGKLEKRLTYSGYKNYGGHWRPARLEMSNLQTGKRTMLEWSDFRFGVDVGAAVMSPQGLQ